MVTEEFDHYFRLCLSRKIDSKEAKQYLFAVNDHAKVLPDDNDVVMVYHVDDDTDAHCYDVRLSSDITAEQGDQILEGLQEIFPLDDFECESSMGTVEEQQYLNSALLEQLSQKLIKI
jgi:hypothetical protein